MAKGFDFNSKELKKVDLFDGEKCISEAEYQEMRKKTIAKNRANRHQRINNKDVDKRTPEQKRKDALAASKIDVAEYKKILKEGVSTERERKMSSNIKSKMSFKDKDGRVVEVVETTSGAISIKFWFFKEDDLGLMYQAIYNKFVASNSVIPREYKRQADILSNMFSICVYLPPQKFHLGFKTDLIKQIGALI